MSDVDTQYAGEIALDILRNGFHQPIENGKINRDNIEEQITLGIYSGELKGVNQEIVDLAISVIEDLIGMDDL
jgi:hypothetical protein